MADLKTDYQDDVLDTTQNTNRVFNIKDSNGDTIYSNVSFEDVTAYLQEGDSYGAQDINEQNQKINGLESSKQDKLTNPLTKADVVNSLSSTATNVPLSAAQGKALNDGKAPLGYTLVGYKVGTASLSLPSNWQELLICVAYSSNILQCVVPKGIYGQIYMGANISGWVGGNVVVNATSAHLISMWNNGSAVTGSSTMYVYYK